MQLEPLSGCQYTLPIGSGGIQALGATENCVREILSVCYFLLRNSHLGLTAYISCLTVSSAVSHDYEMKHRAALMIRYLVGDLPRLMNLHRRVLYECFMDRP